MSLDINLTNVESTTNKKTTLTDNSDTFYPTQKAVKTAVDAKQNTLGFTPENVANLSTDVNTDQASNSKYPSVKAVFDWAVGLFVQKNSAITGATKTKITYDSKGLVTSGADATTADIADSSNKRYVTDAQLTVLGNTSGTNTGDQDLSGYVQDSDFSSHSVLAKQSGAGSPVAVTIGTNEILGRLSGGGSNIEGLSTSQVKTLLDLSGTNTGDQTLSGLGGVPTTRNITINGTTQDLSADRTFTVGNPFPLFGASMGNVIGAATPVTRFFAFLGLTANTAENQRQIPVPYAVTFKNFFCFFGVGASQPVSGSLVLTIRKNGVDTAITITIPAGSSIGTYSDTTNSESFAAGDLISVKAVNNAISVASGNITSLTLGTI